MHVKVSDVFSFLFDVGVDILATTLDSLTGTITAQLGDVTKDVADSDSAEMWYGAPGLVARPALPTQGAASCQAIVLKRGDRDRCLGYRDVRANSIYANLAPGEGCFYATSGQARTLVKADGSARSLTTDNNQATGNTVWCGVSSFYQGLDGQQHLGGEWRYYAPWGGAWHDPSGYHLRTHHGVKIDAGGLTFPSPIGATASTYALKADVVTVRASSVILGAAATAQPVVLSTQLQVLMQSFSTDLTVFAAALSAYATAIKATADPSNAATPAIVAACAALGATVSALMGTIVVETGSRSTVAS